MALIKCPNCQKDVSDKALRCPKCGFSISSRLSTQNSTVGGSPAPTQVKQNNILKVFLLCICIVLTICVGITIVKRHNTRIEIENQLSIIEDIISDAEPIPAVE